MNKKTHFIPTLISVLVILKKAKKKEMKREHKDKIVRKDSEDTNFKFFF